MQIKTFYEHKIVIIFLPINLNMYNRHWDGSFEYPQHNVLDEK